MSDHLLSKLNEFYKASNEIDNLVIIPSGYVMGKPPAEHFNETEQLNRLKTSNISITLPYDNNIYNGNFSNISWREEISHSPKERAEMIYEAISAKDNNGNYKYNNIYFTGGSNTEDVIFELEKICREQGPLPQRKDNLKTYGFSDATQLHHYLGQRGISTPVYYSKNIYALIDDLNTQNNVSTDLNIEPLNDSAKKINELHGYLQPGNQSQVENRPTHQTSFFKNDNNLLVVEFGSKSAAEAFIETSKKFKDENIVLLLSQDSHKEAIDYLVQNTKLPIFNGMPVGHGDCQKNGIAISLFSSADIKKTENGYYISYKNKASDNVFNLCKNQKRTPALTQGGNEQIAVLKEINGSAGAVFHNYEKIKRGASFLSIKIPTKENIVQTMEMSVRTLIENKIINPDNLETLNFQTPPVDKKIQETIKQRILDLTNRYLPKLKKIKHNEITLSGKINSKIASLRGLSSQTKKLYKSQQVNIDPQILKLYQKKKQSLK